jgi:hypothetical protein
MFCLPLSDSTAFEGFFISINRLSNLHFFHNNCTTFTLQAQWILYRYQVEHLNNQHSNHRMHLTCSCGFCNKQRLFPYATLDKWFMCTFGYAAKSAHYLRLCLSVRLFACIKPGPTGRIFMKFDTGDFYESCQKV